VEVAALSTLAQDNKQRFISVPVYPDLRARLEEAARANERLMGGEVRFALKRHLDAAPKEESK
jgi:hypothetical protein